MFENFFSMDGTYARVMNWIWNVFILSVLWFVCCLPIITIGASSTAAYYAASKVIRHKHGKIAPEFFSSFRRNFRQSVPLLLLFGLVFLVVAMECLYLYSDERVPLAVFWLFVAMAVSVHACMTYLWAFLSRFSMSNFMFARISIVLTFKHLISTILLLLLHASAILAFYFMPWGLLVFPGTAFFLETFVMEKVLRRYAPEVSEDDPEAQKWYYQ